MSHVFLYGPPGTGKTTVGEMLAARLSMPFVDLDVQIAAAAGRSIGALMADGEAVFRDVESTALIRAVARPPSVIALGGGALLRSMNRRCAEEHGRIVCLDADEATLLARLAADDTPRPLLGGEPATRLTDLLAERRPHYRSFPTRIRLAGPGQGRSPSPASVADEIMRRLDCLHVRTPAGGGYDVVVAQGALGAVGGLLRERELGGPVVVIADDTVAGLYGERTIGSLRDAGLEPYLTTFPPGERSKTIDTVATVWREMLRAGLERRSCVVALGGGVTGDLAGFAAATFMRGIDWVVVPTTLLAMVDASVGGKTGVDLPEGKNLAGCFHHPRLVVIDPTVLDTLPEDDRRAGMAEVIKHGIIGDPELFASVERDPAGARRDPVDVVRRALAVKVRIVEEDPFERGARATLNLGHTIGHAVEAASGYALRHGEAVAVGLVAEARLAESLGVARPGVAQRIFLAVRGLGLPVTVPDRVTARTVVDAIRVDKKRAAGAVHFTLPVAIGEVRAGVTVQDLGAALEAALAPATADGPSASRSDRLAAERLTRGEREA